MNETPDDGGHNLDPRDGECDGQLGPGRHQAGPGGRLSGQSEQGEQLVSRYPDCFASLYRENS